MPKRPAARVEDTDGWSTAIYDSGAIGPEELSAWQRFYNWATSRKTADVRRPEEIVVPVPRPGLVLDFRRPEKAKSDRLQVLLLRLVVLFVVLFSLVMLVGRAYSILQAASTGGGAGYFSQLFGGKLPAPAVVGFARSALLILVSVVLIASGVGTIRFSNSSRRVLMGALIAFLVLSLLHVGVLNYPDYQSDGAIDTKWLVLRDVIYVMVAGAIVVLLAYCGALFDVRFADESPDIVSLVNKLLSEALRVRASDVHVEPGSEGVAVRYRIDGVLHTVATCPTAALDRIVARIKVIGGMDIAEKRMPQDGSSVFSLPDRDVDLRISTVPSNFGERAVVRLLDRATGLLGLEGLGLTPELVDVLKHIVRSPYGVLFSTGPTGCGKTTTLYAALTQVDSAERNVITVEDPIEYQLPGITQLPIRSKKGMTFASGLRSILRQDPDVLMVGEVRDSETAHIVIEAAQTGHMVLTTLHTNDSAGAIARLLDLGVEPFLLASCLTAVLAQRLVRCICPNCKEAYVPTAEQVADFGLGLAERPTLYRGRGCEVCMGTGYRGRTGLFELLIVDDAVRDLITERANAMAIRKRALKRGMLSLRADGMRKAMSGTTTVEEVDRVTKTNVDA
jgi:type II secretory ATPase GspE/PulE/Tfp pilus assembly ATPase PilB-like protein